MTRPLAELRDEVRRLAALQQLLDGEPEDGPIKGKVPIASATILALLDCAVALAIITPGGGACGLEDLHMLACGHEVAWRISRDGPVPVACFDCAATAALAALERAGWSATPPTPAAGEKR